MSMMTALNTPATFARQVATIVGKDLRCELRTRQTWTAMGLFALLVLVVFNFAFDLRVANAAAVAPVPGDAPWLGLIAAFDVIFISISTITFEYAVEE